MTPPSPNDAARATARLHLQATHAALAAALSHHAGGDNDTDSGAADAEGGPRPPLVLLLAERAVAPWAAERPWTLMAVAALAGGLLASRRGRTLLGSAVLAAVLAPVPRRGGLPALGAAGFGWLLRRRAAPPGPARAPGPPR